jgi:hypothetical protein
MPWILSWRRGLPVAVGGGRAWLASRWSPASVDLLVVKMSASCWRNWLFGRSRPPWPGVAVILGTSADIWLCPWPTQKVIPMTLALITGEVSWDSMGLQWILSLAEVNSHTSKSQGFSFGWKVVDLEVKSPGVWPTFSARAGSRTAPAGSCSAAVSRRPALRNLCLLKSRPTLPPACTLHRNVPSPAVA